MRISTPSSFLLLLLSSLPHQITPFSATAPENLSIIRSRLKEALYSPSGKLTFSPELIIPEPTDPTALLLKNSEVIKLSERIRSTAKANVAFVQGSVGSLRTFAKEQEENRGQFPGPVPIIFTESIGGEEDGGEVDLEEIMEAGVSGLVVSVLHGKAIKSPDDLDNEDGSLKQECEAALKYGLQPIPEVTLCGGIEWSEENVEKLVEIVTEQCGGKDVFVGEEEGFPVSIILTIDAPEEEEEEDEDGAEKEEEGGEEKAKAAYLPQIPKSLGKRIPIIGSVKVPAGGGRMGTYTKLMKSSGFTGAYLRADCVPGFRMNPDLEVVGNFWCAVVGDLKSVKSKSFSFRSKVQLDRDIPLEWYNYQKNVMESGALGEPTGGGGPDLDTEGGDYVGF
mmetsp:Transcript_9011/g.12459  ORF Transcript_9011/g.12459 Transcript_9011/m.12459 type:complete len:393 (-) Transcript_9011:80-1258(-)|eukprot:CAMPEP_0185729302 /NCGR_PEP_ID=MMETSP1171-20130828/5082_1 /TAXON_ID=374046 /ORGANISM="Helicotheca tamensis, Strain CCMP826" /LENGTH=392 /DNA_ID=CAMNT_0028398103 /DNA_START=40 /DNA_END=1218 /DNA_ORIENTATION=-